MTRPLRIEFDGAWYHIINRGQDRRKIVRSDSDRKRFFNTLEETIETYGIEVHAFSLMNNHYHLLIRTPNAGLSNAMRHFNGVYTQRCNIAWRKDGPLYKGRYKAILIEEDDYLIQLVRYIHLNPVKANICKKAQNHPWTSHKCYLNPKNAPNWLNTNHVLSRFGKTTKTAIKHMNNFVQDGVPLWFSEDLLKNRIVLGSEGFKNWVYNNEVKIRKKGISKSDAIPKGLVPIKKVLENVCFAYNIKQKELKTNTDRTTSQARSVTIFLARQMTNLNQRQIAKALDLSNEYTVAKSLERFKAKLNQDKHLNVLVKKLTHKLMSIVKP
ncbi:hypothetical protein BVY03_05750 [bacterium K02(2017)]|nr:hypothetical protein BVY03_05750 [bacterium K02(2017)]